VVSVGTLGHNRQVGGGQDCDDACDLTRCLAIHQLDARVRLRTENKPSVEEPGKR
jgi:hypothetical protein